MNRRSPTPRTPQPSRTAVPRGRGVVLVAMCVGLFLVQLDVTVVNVALPSIGDDLGASVNGLQWVVDGYAVPFAALLLAGGALGDRYGHRRMVVTGLIVFGAGSAACGAAPDVGALIAARAVQGVGAAALLPATLAVITRAYPERRERAKAIGIWAAVAGLALPLGPVLGSLLVAGPGWQWVFLLNVPVVLAALVPVPAVVPADRGRGGGPLDLPGTVLGALVLTGCALALTEGGRVGWTSAAEIGTVAATLAAAVAFRQAERRHPDPMLPLELFRDRGFSAANGLAVVMNLVGIGTIFVSTLYLQGVQHREPVAAGAAMLPMFVPLIGLAPLTGRITARYGPRPPAVAGLLLAGTGMALLTVVQVDSPYARLLPTFLLLGTGLGLLTTPLVSTAVAAVPGDRAGLASGVNNTARQAGGAVGIALFGTLTGAATRHRDFVAGLHLVGAVAAVLCALAAVTALALLPSHTADHG